MWALLKPNRWGAAQEDLAYAVELEVRQKQQAAGLRDSSEALQSVDPSTLNNLGRRMWHGVGMSSSAHAGAFRVGMITNYCVFQ